MTVSIVNTWTGGYAQPTGFFFPRSATGPVQVSVADVTGDWMIAVIALRPPTPNSACSVCVSDDVHNWWEPVGAPAADSPSPSTVRTVIWAAPVARGASFVQVAPTGPYTSLAVAIYDVAGLGPGWLPSLIGANHASPASSLTVPGGSVASQSLVLAILAAGEFGGTITPPAGWTALTGSTISGGGTGAGDITVSAAYQVLTGSVPSAAWSSSVSCALAGTTGAVAVAAAVPVQPSANWPAVITEAAIGAGPQSSPAAMTWTDLSGRSLALQVQQGRQYTLSQLQAAQGTILLDDPDGALIPPGTGSFAGIDSGTPLRRRCYWPGSAWQVQFSGNGSTSSPQLQSSGSQVPVTPGVTYTAPVWLACSVAYASGVHSGIVWRNGGGGVISTVTSATSATGPAPVLCTASGIAPAGAVTADVLIGASGTPAASVVFTAAAGPYATGQVTAPPGVSWAAQNGASVTTLAPWQPDPRGAPNPSPWSVPFSGYFRRWPFTTVDGLLRGQVAAEVSDIWAYATGALDSIAREELLTDQPYALWPLGDQAGATAGSNIAPGNSNPLALVTSKMGAGSASAAFGTTPPGGGLLGDSSAKTGANGMFRQTIPASGEGVNGFGYALGCYDGGYPGIAAGVTLEVWAQGTANQNTTGNGFSAVTSGSLFTVTGSSFPNGTPVVLTAVGGFSFPGGFTAGQVYYVISVNGASFQLAGAIGGSAITVTSNGSGFLQTTTSWNPVVISARNVKGPVVELNVRNTDGALQLLYATASGARTTVVIDTSLDYRNTALWHASVAFNSTTYRVLVNGGATASASGSFSASLPSFFDEVWVAGILDRQVSGFTFPGYLALAGVWPGMLTQIRVVAHYWGAHAGMKLDPAAERLDRLLGYAGIAGRRWIGQQSVTYETDVLASGQDIGGQSAAANAGNIAASTVPALLYIAPTGDISYAAKQYQWNNAVDWVLGDNTAAGEIPFTLMSFSTDYDPARLYNDVQLTQLDSQSVTVPAGATATTTVTAMVAASEAQYGDQPYQQTAYLQADGNAAYNAGAGLVDLAAWIAMVYGKPRNRVPGVTVNAAAYPSAWQLFTRAAVDDMVQVNVRLPTAATSPLVSVIARVTQTNRSMKWDVDSPPVATIALTLDAAPEYQALTCDDATRGLLNGANVLAW